MTIPLPAETLLLEGADASAFAQAQFSSAVTQLEVHHWQFSAWLDPKGRVLAFFHLARLADDCYLALLRGGKADTMAEALRRFVFRSKVRITALPPRMLKTGPALALGSVMSTSADTGSHDELSLGCDSHSVHITRAGEGDSAWQLMQLRNGWPWLAASCLGELLPPALSLQRLRAVAVDKGCYPGQEIVARMHFRGGHKRHLHRVTLSQAADAGDPLRMNDQEAGKVINVVSEGETLEALVVLRDEIADEPNNSPTRKFDDGMALNILASWPA